MKKAASCLTWVSIYSVTLSVSLDGKRAFPSDGLPLVNPRNVEGLRKGSNAISTCKRHSLEGAVFTCLNVTEGSPQARHCWKRGTPALKKFLWPAPCVFKVTLAKPIKDPNCQKANPSLTWLLHYQWLYQGVQDNETY